MGQATTLRSSSGSVLTRFSLAMIPRRQNGSCRSSDGQLRGWRPTASSQVSGALLDGGGASPRLLPSPSVRWRLVSAGQF